MNQESIKKKKSHKRRWILAGFMVFILGISTTMIISDSGRVKIDTTMPEFPTGVYLTEGRYKIAFSGGWNLNRHVPHPDSTVQTLIGPAGIDWPESDTRPWAFPSLKPMSTAIKIGEMIIPAREEMIVDVKKVWLKGNEKLQLGILINDIAGTHYDNGPGIWFTKYLPVWQKRPYEVEITKVEA